MSSFKIPSFKEAELKLKEKSKNKNNENVRLREEEVVEEEVEEAETSDTTIKQEKEQVTFVNNTSTNNKRPRIPQQPQPIQSTTTYTSSSNSSLTIKVNSTQKENPLLKHLKSPYEILPQSTVSNVNIPDYTTKTQKIFFLSLKYHKLHSDYLYRKTKSSLNSVLLLLCDTNEDLTEINKYCVLNGICLILSWSFEECGKIIDLYHQEKSVDLIRKNKIEKIENNLSFEDEEYLQLLQECFKCVKGVSRSDVLMLFFSFGGFSGILDAVVRREEEVLLVPGLGEKKVKKMKKVFEANFYNK